MFLDQGTVGAPIEGGSVACRAPGLVAVERRLTPIPHCRIITEGEHDQPPQLGCYDPEYMQPLRQQRPRDFELAVWYSCGKSIFGKEPLNHEPSTCTCSGSTLLFKQETK